MTKCCFTAQITQSPGNFQEQRNKSALLTLAAAPTNGKKTFRGSEGSCLIENPKKSDFCTSLIVLLCSERKRRGGVRGGKGNLRWEKLPDTKGKKNPGKSSCPPSAAPRMGKFWNGAKMAFPI